MPKIWLTVFLDSIFCEVDILITGKQMADCDSKIMPKSGNCAFAVDAQTIYIKFNQTKVYIQSLFMLSVFKFDVLVAKIGFEVCPCS